MQEKKEIKAEKELNNGGVTGEQIQMWKARYRKVSEISVVDGEETHVGFFHRPDMETMAAVNKVAKTDEVKAANTLFDNCWLGGSPVMKDDAVVRMAAIGKINELMAVSTSSIKNL